MHSTQQGVRAMGSQFPRRVILLWVGLFVIILVTPGCPTTMPDPCDGVDCAPDEDCVEGECVRDPNSPQAIPRSTACAQIAIGCFDELARQRADSIRFRPNSRWPRTTLTWRMKNTLETLPQNGQIMAAGRAFSRWSIQSKLIFELVETDDADIEIVFEQREHGDMFAFDGPGGNLGHAFFPSTLNSGEIHLDFEENWALTPGAGQVDLFTVLLHDIGHALGLEHSPIPGAVMHPDYPVDGHDGLHDDDIKFIQRLYGSADGLVKAFVFDPTRLPTPPDLLSLNDPDSDDDGIPDSMEVLIYGTDPFKVDTDDDGDSDYEELFVLGTLPTAAGMDTDNDGLPDALEAIRGTDPNNADTDGDGISDGTEAFSNTDPKSADTDGDGCEDGEDVLPNVPTANQADCVNCDSDQDCDDGAFCNGRELCRSGQCQPATAPCPAGADCDEDNDFCVLMPICQNDGRCNDGRFCTGEERCVNGLCESGTPPCGAGLTCDEMRSECVLEVCVMDSACGEGERCIDGDCVPAEKPDCKSDLDCNDGAFCNGPETCSAEGSCLSGSGPCEGLCDEVNDVCVVCFDNRDCDDGSFCNGLEICSTGTCFGGVSPCQGQETCNEFSDSCVPNCLTDVPWIVFTDPFSRVQCGLINTDGLAMVMSFAGQLVILTGTSTPDRAIPNSFVDESANIFLNGFFVGQLRFFVHSSGTSRL